jgi:hypothetical protein
MRHTVASFLEARQIVGELARILPGKLPREALGQIMGITHSSEFEPDAIDVELGFIVNGELPATLPPVGRWTLGVRELPPVPLMAACVRIGLPEQAHLVTGKIGRYVELSGLRLAGPGREVFLRPPRPDRMEESVVEMQFPVERG